MYNIFFFIAGQPCSTLQTLAPPKGELYNTCATVISQPLISTDNGKPERQNSSHNGSIVWNRR